MVVPQALVPLVVLAVFAAGIVVIVPVAEGSFVDIRAVAGEAVVDIDMVGVEHVFVDLESLQAPICPAVLVSPVRVVVVADLDHLDYKNYQA